MFLRVKTAKATNTRVYNTKPVIWKSVPDEKLPGIDPDICFYEVEYRKP